LGPCPEGHEVNHVDENPSNPRANNLEYLTHLENIRHSRTRFLATRVALTGEKHPSAKLSSGQAREIRERYGSGGTSYARLGRDYGVSPITVRKVVRRISHKFA
jgi:hypothetical protein